MIDQIFEALSDGRWHSVADIANSVEPHKKTIVHIVLTFLGEFDLVHFFNNQVRLDGSAEQFLKNIKRLEKIEET